MKFILPYSTLSRQLTSFSFVGLLSNALGYGAYLLLVANQLDPKLAVTLLYPVGVAVGYLGNKRITFRYAGKFISSSLGYAVVYILGYLINIALIICLVDYLGYPNQIVQLIAIPLVAVTSFVLLRKFVFASTSIS